MKQPGLLLAAVLAMSAATAGSAWAEGVTRVPTMPPGRILTGVRVPAGTEILYLSGQLAAPIDPSRPADSIAAYGDTRTQTVSTLRKIKALLAAQGYAMSDIIKMTAFVTAAPGMDGRMDFAGFNAGFDEFFGTADNPRTVARSTVQVAGLAGPYYLVELEVTAARAAP
ncbi:RidA family protein [Polymorphobacter sp.]|uniref:RidA family protein n=1 Tax=Polymorphobacter sp. TaxID=1909290 RepID=UPI003F6E4D38